MVINAQKIPPMRAGFNTLLEYSKRNKGGEDGRVRIPLFYAGYGDSPASNRVTAFNLCVGGNDEAIGSKIKESKEVPLLGDRPHPFIEIGDPFCCLSEALLLEGDEAKFLRLA